jgi:hypothetical protein
MTPKAGAPQARQSGKVDRARRKLVKLIAAGGVGAIASPWMFQSSRAAAKTIKIGMITPETGPIAAFGEPSKMGGRGREQSFGRRHRGRRRGAPGANPQPG